MLTEATKQVLTDNVKTFALEYGCVDKYIYGILYEEKNDPFEQFLKWFAAGVRANAPVIHWLNALNEVRVRYAKHCNKTLTQCLAETLIADSGVAVELTHALEDGSISPKEKKAILAAIEKKEQALARLKNKLAEEVIEIERGQI